MTDHLNILIIGAFGEGAMENYYVPGLKKAGANVSTYDISTDYYSIIGKNIFNKAINKLAPGILLKTLNDKLKLFIADQKFDAILVFKGMQLYSDTIHCLKPHTKVLANYNPDHPFKFYSNGSGNRNVLDSINLFDIYFSYSSQITKQLNEQFITEAHTIPFGYADTGILPGKKIEGICSKVLFIGSYDRERAAFLNIVADEHLQIYGDDKWESRNIRYPKIRKVFQKKAIYTTTYKQAVSDSAGIINLLREQNVIEQSHNMRTFEVPGYGGVMIAQRTEEQLSFFEENKEALYFETAEELKEKINFLIKNPLAVSQIKNAAYDRSVRSGYSYDHRAFQLLEIIKSKY